MRARGKIIVGFGLALSILAVAGWFAYGTTTELIRTSHNVRRTYRVREQLVVVLSLLKDTETGARGYVITGADEYLAPYQAATRALNRALRHLRALLGDSPQQRRRLDALEPLIAARLNVLKEVIEIRRQNGLTAAAQAIRAGPGKVLMDRIRAAVAGMKNAQTALLRRQEDESEARTRDTLVALALAALLAFSILLLVFYLLQREINERERAQAALRRSEEHFRSLIENVADLIGLLNADGTVRYASPSHERVLGYALDDLIGKNAFDLVHADDAPALMGAFEHVVRTPGATASMQFRYRHRDGSWRTLEGVAKNLLDIPAVGCIVVNSRDITERKAAEEAARQREAELAHVLRVSTIGEMAAGLAHEVNQPLSAIVSYAKGCARRMRAGSGEPGELLGAMEEIAAQAVRANQIIRRLRNFVRKREPRREHVDLNDLVRHVARMVAGEAAEHRISIQLDLASGMRPVEVDDVQIEQVILNLVRNGIEAMHGVAVEKPVLSIHTVMAGHDAVEVAVCDAGGGLRAGEAEHVFDPFFTTKPTGLGMGLSISRTIVEAHGGQLWAVPNPDCGTTFRFTVPVANGEGNDAV